MNKFEQALVDYPLELNEPLICVVKRKKRKDPTRELNHRMHHTPLVLPAGKDHAWTQTFDGGNDRKKSFKPGDRVKIDEQPGYGGGFGVITRGPDGTTNHPIQRVEDEDGNFIGLYHEVFLHHVGKCMACECGDCFKHAYHTLEGHTIFQGLSICIENDIGSVRSGVSRDGIAWSVTMTCPYGYIEGTEGVDGDHVDCFIGPNSEAKTAYVIHTNDNTGRNYDEDKCMLGFDGPEQALQAFLDNYNDAKFFRHIEALPMAEFKEKVLATKGNPYPITIVKSYPVILLD
jgi:hypothetical protein